MNVTLGAVEAAGNLFREGRQLEQVFVALERRGAALPHADLRAAIRQADAFRSQVYRLGVDTFGDHVMTPGHSTALVTGGWLRNADQFVGRDPQGAVRAVRTGHEMLDKSMDEVLAALRRNIA